MSIAQSIGILPSALPRNASGFLEAILLCSPCLLHENDRFTSNKKKRTFDEPSPILDLGLGGTVFSLERRFALPRTYSGISTDLKWKIPAS